MRAKQNNGRPKKTVACSDPHEALFNTHVHNVAPPSWWLNLFRLTLTLGLGFWVYHSEQSHQQHQLTRLQSLSTALTNRITATIHHSTLALYPLGALALQNGTILQLNSLAQHMRKDMPAILNVAVMPGGVMKQIEPLGPNAEAIGHDMLSDPKRRPEAMRAIDTGELTVSGPYQLIQGGGGLVARLPVFQQNEFWGFVSIVYDFPELLETLGLSELRSQGLQFRIGDQQDGRFREILGNTEQLATPSVRTVIPLPNNHWHMEVAYSPSFNWLLLARLSAAALIFWLGSVLFKQWLRGVGHRKALERSLARHNELSDRHTNQQRLLARVSHDLRAPMQHVLNEIRQLSRDKNHSQKPVQTIEQNMRYQLELIEQLLEYTSSPQREQACHSSPGYLYRFLYDIFEQAGFLAHHNNNRLHNDIANDLPGVIHADFRQLQRILINLLSNAAKYTQRGDIHFRVQRLSTTPGVVNLVRFMVDDNGPGLPATALPKAPGERNGIGLMIVSDLLRLMGSHLQYQPREEGGSRFYFDLPLVQPDDETSPEPFIESHVPDWQGDELHILVVDSDATVRDGLHELLAGYGCTVRTSPGCREAATELAEAQFDLIITEQRLRDGHGQVVLTTARNLPSPPAVLLYSQWLVPAPDPHGDWHYDAAVLKPASSLQLLHTIHRLCREAGESGMGG